MAWSSNPENLCGEAVLTVHHHPVRLAEQLGSVT